MLRGKVARTLGQPSAAIGTVPFIDSAAAAASSPSRRSRSPQGLKQEKKTIKTEQKMAKTEPKTEWSVKVPILDEITGLPLMNEEMAKSITQYLVRYSRPEEPSSSSSAAAAAFAYADDPRPQPKAKAKTKPKSTRSSSSSAAAAGPIHVGNQSDDDVQVTGSNINRRRDISFWENENSVNEIRAQIAMRGILRPIDFQFKKKNELIAIIKDLIRQGLW